ncbi:MAG: hypothetical protein GTN81_07385 [Proteobacteria bacterium]|nr:hypothetical protein [Pseudomonadota bacterium]
MASNDDLIFDVENFFDLVDVSFSDLFEGTSYVWEALNKRDSYIREHMDPNTSGIQANGFHIEDDVYVGHDTVIEPGAYIKDPTIIGDNCEIRQGAYIRGNVIVGNNCVIGHATEVTRSIILNNVRADHFAYIGDSILGNNCHLGAGVILANAKMRTKTPSVTIRVNGKSYDTGMKKLGGIFGDNTEIGCNGTANPGTILGKGVAAYPGMILSGYYSTGRIISSTARGEKLLSPSRLQNKEGATIERVMCPQCGEPFANLTRVKEVIVYCKEFFGQCSCGQKYHITLSLSGGAILSFPDRQIQTYLQVPDRKHAAPDPLPH